MLLASVYGVPVIVIDLAYFVAVSRVNLDGSGAKACDSIRFYSI